MWCLKEQEWKEWKYGAELTVSASYRCWFGCKDLFCNCTANGNILMSSYEILWDIKAVISYVVHNDCPLFCYIYSYFMLQLYHIRHISSPLHLEQYLFSLDTCYFKISISKRCISHWIAEWWYPQHVELRNFWEMWQNYVFSLPWLTNSTIFSISIAICRHSLGIYLP